MTTGSIEDGNTSSEIHLFVVCCSAPPRHPVTGYCERDWTQVVGRRAVLAPCDTGGNHDADASSAAACRRCARRGGILGSRMMGIGLRNTGFGRVWMMNKVQTIAGSSWRGFISGTAVDCTRRRSGDGIFTCERGFFCPSSRLRVWI